MMRSIFRENRSRIARRGWRLELDGKSAVLSRNRRHRARLSPIQRALEEPGQIRERFHVDDNERETPHVGQHEQVLDHPVKGFSTCRAIPIQPFRQVRIPEQRPQFGVEAGLLEEWQVLQEPESGARRPVVHIWSAAGCGWTAQAGTTERAIYCDFDHIDCSHV